MMEALLRASRGETPEETPRAVVVDTGTEEMKAGFASFDRGTGFISIDEVKALCYALGIRVKRKEIKALLAKKGKGDAENIDFREFQNLFRERVEQRTVKDSDEDVFRLLDVESKGRVNAANLTQVCQEMGEDLEEEDIREMVDETARYRAESFRLEDYRRLIRLRDKDLAEDQFIEEKLARREARRSGEFG